MELEEEEELSDCSDKEVICVMFLITLTSYELIIYLPYWRWEIVETANCISSPIFLVHFLLILHFELSYLVRHRWTMLASSFWTHAMKKFISSFYCLKDFTASLSWRLRLDFTMSLSVVDEVSGVREEGLGSLRDNLGLTLRGDYFSFFYFCVLRYVDLFKFIL